MAIALSLVASLCWGTTDFLGGLVSRRVPVPVVIAMTEGVGLVLIVAIALIASDPVPPVHTLAVAAAAGVSGVGGLGCFFWALSLGKMSVVAPISASGAALPAIYGVATGDPFSVLLGLGLVAALAGIVLVSLEDSGEQAAAAPPGRLAIGLAAAAALGFGGYYILFDKVADESVTWSLAAARAIPMVVVITVIAVRGLRLPHGRLRVMGFGAGVLDISATGLYGVALTKGSLSVVSVVGSLFPLTTVVLARVLLGERVRLIQRVGIACALGGVAMIAAS